MQSNSFYLTGAGGQSRPPPRGPEQGVVVVVMPRMALIWLMMRSLIMPMRRSSTKPLSTVSPASASSAGTGLAKATEQMRKENRRVLIIFSGAQTGLGTGGRQEYLYLEQQMLGDLETVGLAL